MKYLRMLAVAAALVVGGTAMTFAAPVQWHQDRDHDRDRDRDKDRKDRDHDRDRDNRIRRDNDRDRDNWRWRQAQAERERHEREEQWRRERNNAPYYGGYNGAPVYRGPVYSGPVYNGNGRYPYGYGNGSAGYGNVWGAARQYGYQDGVNDGRHDRATGHSFRPTQDDNYKNATRGWNGSVDKNQYKSAYRQSYEQGYQQGYNSGGGFGWGR